jgi:hypothetical protein
MSFKESSQRCGKLSLDYVKLQEIITELRKPPRKGQRSQRSSKKHKKVQKDSSTPPEMGESTVTKGIISNSKN